MAGKTTIVKRLMNKPLDGISPTLGFEITTYTYEDKGVDGSGDTYNLNICTLPPRFEIRFHALTGSRGCWGTRDLEIILAQLFRKDRLPDLGRGRCRQGTDAEVQTAPP